MVKVNYDVEFELNMSKFNKSFTIPESFEKMIKELKEIKNEQWVEQILSDTDECDEELFGELLNALNESVSHLFVYDSAEINFSELIRSYFYTGEFEGEIFIYWTLSAELKNSMLLTAFYNGVEIPDELLVPLISDELKEIKTWAEPETLIVELRGINLWN